MVLAALVRVLLGPDLDADDRGASSVEYALIVGFIAAVIVGAVVAFGSSVNALFGVDFNP